MIRLPHEKEKNYGTTELEACFGLHCCGVGVDGSRPPGQRLLGMFWLWRPDRGLRLRLLRLRRLRLRLRALRSRMHTMLR
jgi:hypothetical protein